MTEPGKAVPSIPIAPGNFDRAWNDPPQFSYNDSTGHQKPGSRLNRRVGYALDGGPPPPMGQPVHPSGTTLPDAGAKALPGSGMPLPPPPSSCGPPPPLSGSAPPTQSTPPTIDNTNIEDDLTSDEISAQLKNLMTEHCGSKSADLLKRLILMEKSLDPEHHTGPTQNKIISMLSQFVKLIQKADLTEAEARLTSLGADYPAECAQWIICLRHLLADIKSKQQRKVETQEQSFPYFMPVPQENKD